MKIIQEKLWSKAVELMPRGTQTMSKCPDQFVDGVYPKFVRKAKGAYLWDIDGNKYLDYIMQISAVSFQNNLFFLTIKIADERIIVPRISPPIMSVKK